MVCQAQVRAFCSQAGGSFRMARPAYICVRAVGMAPIQVSSRADA